jgi:hypothetical protein
MTNYDLASTRDFNSIERNIKRRHPRLWPRMSGLIVLAGAKRKDY